MSSEKEHSSNPFSKCCKTASTSTVEKSVKLSTRCQLYCCDNGDSAGRASQVPHTGEGKSRKHCDFLTSDDYRPIWFKSFPFQTQRRSCCPGQVSRTHFLFAQFFSSLRSNRKCDTFSYTTKVIQQAGVTLIKLGAIPL